MLKFMRRCQARTELRRINENLDALQLNADCIRYENPSNAYIQLEMDRYQDSIDARRANLRRQMAALI